MRRIVRTRSGGLWVAAVLTGMMLAFAFPAAAGQTKATYTPPFTQCPQIKTVRGCTLLLVFKPTAVSVLRDSLAGPFDAEGDEFLVGVQNDSGATLHGIYLESNEQIFKFETEGDGLCTYITCTWPHPTTDEGPNTSFEIVDSTYRRGYVHFPKGLAPGASTFFDLEQDTLTTVTVEPVFGQTAGLGKTSGNVCYYKPGVSAETGQCIPVKAGAGIKIGSIINTLRGTASLRTFEGPSQVNGGRFKLVEYKLKGAGSQGRRVTELALVASRSLCSGTRSLASVSKKKPHRKVVQRLFVKAKGAYRTRGRYSSGTVRGTRWLTEELCDGTLIRVLQGTVFVRDFVLHKVIILKKGQTYIAGPH